MLNKVWELFNEIEQVDAAPTSQRQAALSDLQTRTKEAMETWKTLQPPIAKLNAELAAAGLEPIQTP